MNRKLKQMESQRREFRMKIINSFFFLIEEYTEKVQLTQNTITRGVDKENGE